MLAAESNGDEDNNLDQRHVDIDYSNRIILINDLQLNSWTDDLLKQIDDKEAVAMVPCIAHTLNIVLKDAMKNTESILTTMDLCRAVAKELRREQIRNELILKNVYAVQPKLDVETRWSTKYAIVKHTNYNNIFTTSFVLFIDIGYSKMQSSNFLL